MATLKLEEVVLDRLPMRLNLAEDPSIGYHIRDSLMLRKWQEQMLDRMMYELSAYVLAEKLVDKTIKKDAFFSVQVPSSWWQHFKDDVLDRFFLTRWIVRWRPVKYDTIESKQILTANFKQYAAFPAADIRTPADVHKHVIVAKEFIDTWTERYDG